MEFYRVHTGRHNSHEQVKRSKVIRPVFSAKKPLMSKILASVNGDHSETHHKYSLSVVYREMQLFNSNYIFQNSSFFLNTIRTCQLRKTIVSSRTFITDTVMKLELFEEIWRARGKRCRRKTYLCLLHLICFSIHSYSDWSDFLVSFHLDLIKIALWKKTLMLTFIYSRTYWMAHSLRHSPDFPLDHDSISPGG